MSKVNISGVWLFDAAASTDPDAVATLEGFNWLSRKVIASLTYAKLTLEQTETSYSMTLESTFKNDELQGEIGGAPFAKDIDGVMNKVNIFLDDDGTVLSEKHRFVNAEGQPVIRVHRRFLEDNGNTLIQETSVDVDGQSAWCRRVFRRA
eukprot:TRINITY_DN3567_c0_g4_i1.p1 TRINITY_DN3567_c0_g4~~TRINITY_DN3567_c0_g4_i1.p1  ORF type:complete len:150 (+),score=42.50 TRINITY_DN3567_c0_g4_i1:50-499(+)